MLAPARVLFLAGETGENRNSVEPLYHYFQKSHQVRAEVQASSRLPAELNHYQVIILTDAGVLSLQAQQELMNYVAGGGGCLALGGSWFPSIFGVQTGNPGPVSELRVRFSDPQHPIARRLPAEFQLYDRFLPLKAVDENTQFILTTVWCFQEAGLAVIRHEGKGIIGCTTLQAYGEPFLQQFVYRLVRHLAGMTDPAPLQVAILGYGPLGSVGYLHALALKEVPGYHLRAFCDYSPQRLLQCRQDFPECRAYESADELGRDPDVDLVVIATPPNTHAALAIQLLQAGKHIVCEKPLCLTRTEAEEMIEASQVNGRILTCYQNRRWDLDFLAIQNAIRSGWIGDLFYLETFVGNFVHPCSYWHSHQPISGDAAFDWGAHHVDWILSLFPGPTLSITGTRHKRVWHDVTNADQIRVQILFQDGREAEFLYSDIAALRKPKWYLLGTEGAIVGHWSEVTVRETDPVDFYREKAIPVTESLPRLMLRRRQSPGVWAEQQMPVSSPGRFPFHRNLADHLLLGEPLAVSAQSAARVVAVLEAATRSSQNDGRPESLSV
jgi:predicted dehydrogenase